MSVSKQSDHQQLDLGLAALLESASAGATAASEGAEKVTAPALTSVASQGERQPAVHASTAAQETSAEDTARQPSEAFDDRASQPLFEQLIEQSGEPSSDAGVKPSSASNGTPQQVDLSENRAASAAQDPSKQSTGGDPVVVQDSTAVADVPLSRSPFEELAENRSWESLSDLCDRITTEGEGALSAEHREEHSARQLAARLWWIKAQIERSSVPLSMLAAPLCSATLSHAGTVELPPKLTALAAELLKRVGEALPQSDEQRAVLLARAEQLCPSMVEAVTAIKPSVDTPPLATIQDGADPSAAPALEVRAGTAWVTHLVSLCCAALIVLVGLARLFSPRAMRIEEVATVTEKAPQLIAPEPERVGRFSHFDALVYQFGSSISAGSTATTQSSLEARAGTANPRSPAQSKRPNPRIPESVVAANSRGDGGREVINTSTPIEPEQPRPERGEARFGEFPPSPLFDRPSDAASAAPVQERYAAPRSYRIVVRTRVSATPDFRGAQMGRLEPDDIVIADGREGNFLRVRSSKGGIGYVFAQDAVEAPGYENLRN